MSLFCLLCIPLFFFLRRTVVRGERYSIWALSLGIVMAFIRHFVGPLMVPDGFGLSRWMSGFVDIIGLPALIPLMVYLLLVVLKIFSVNTPGEAGFALLWLIPLAVIRSINGGTSPLALIIAPLLWIAQSAGIPFFIGCITRYPRWYAIIPSALAIAALPIAATTSWWFFFSQRNLFGGMLLAAALVPAALPFIQGERE